MSSKIDLTFEGLLLLFWQPGREECVVGFLTQTPTNHDFKITVTKNGFPHKTLTGAEIMPELKLEVTNVSQPGITLSSAPIDRGNKPTAANMDSFLWAVDIEREVYKKPIGAKRLGFISMFTVNNGKLVTRQPSDNKLRVRPGFAGDWKEFGYVAVRVGIDIVLDQANSRAVFSNGNEIIFDADSATNYKVMFSRGEETLTVNDNDADAYYTAMGHLIPEGEKIFFASVTKAETGLISPPSTPDAACFPGFMFNSIPEN